MAIQQEATGLRELALFAGAGGGILGGHLLGWRTVCAVEWDAYAASVLVACQNDGCLPPFPIWDDVQTFDGRPWRGRVDVVSGGFPCQDISCAGRGAGIEGERSGMWGHMARIVGEVRPRFVFVENSPMLVGRGLARVLGDLASMGYDARWGIVGAHHAGAPHRRDRLWIVAYADSLRELQPQGRKQNERGWPGDGGSYVADTTSERQQRQGQHWFSSDPAEAREREADHAFAERIGHIWGIESPVGRVAHGVANRVDRLRAIGNGQVPAVVRLAWEILTETNQ